MKGKRAQFFGIYLVFLTLLFMGIVISMYYVQQKNIDSFLVSPKIVLEVEDSLWIYELQEKEIINKSLSDALENSDFGTEDFINSFRNSFFDELDKSESMKEFIFKGLLVKGRPVEKEARLQGLDFFKEVLYPVEETKFKNGKLIFKREVVGKGYSLFAPRRDKISFPVDFYFKFSKEYIISLENEEFVLEER